MRHARVNDARLRSPLNEAMRVNPRGGSRSKKKMVATLILTSLVDAFSIMLLYLLVNNTGSSSTLELKESERLPIAVKTEGLNPGTMIRIQGDKYFVGEQPVELEQLATVLQKTRADIGSTVPSDEAESLIIQADRDVDFSKVEPIVRAGSISGFHKFKFAVMQGEEKP